MVQTGFPDPSGYASTATLYLGGTASANGPNPAGTHLRHAVIIRDGAALLAADFTADTIGATSVAVTAGGPITVGAGAGIVAGP